MFAGSVCQCATMWSDIPVLGLLAFGDGPLDAFQPLGAALLHLLVGFPSLLGSLLVDVVGRVGLTPVSSPPSRDALVYGVGVVLAAALGQCRFPVQDVDGVVVGHVLLGGVVADGPTVVLVAAQGEFQGCDHCLMINCWPFAWIKLHGAVALCWGPNLSTRCRQFEHRPASI